MSADRGSPVALRVAGGIASVRIDHPPVNALSRSVRAGLLAAFEAIAARDDVRAVVLECAGRTFVAGADIREFGRPPEPPSLREVFDAIEQCERPVVAAIHGTALGGGLELALCCHRRLCTASARVGLPEVRLGILPGAGGTQRLPRLIGAEAALDLMLTGRHVPADEAASLGLIDAVVDEPLDASARQHAEALAAAGSPPRRVRDLAPREPDGLSDVLAAARERAARELRGQHAPARIVECVAAAFERPFEDGLAFEREQIRAAFADPQSAALRHVFFAERAAVRVPDLAAEARARPIARAGVVGGGTMGRGIAIALAEAGIDVTVIEATPDALAACRREIGRVLRRALDRGRIDERGLTARLDRVTGSVDLAALAEADIVIEAVYENLALKTEVFAHVDRVVRPRTILATNTSYLDVDRIAAATSRPEDVLGLHFFSPAHVMRLLEIVRGASTADDVLVTALDLARRMGKVPVVARVCDGFIGNRMLSGYRREAERLLLEGASPARVDRVIRDFGFPMGPFQMADLAGLDVGARARAERRAAGRDTEDPRFGAVLDRLAELGRHGQKTGAGVYRYAGRRPEPDPEVDALIEGAAAELGVERRAVDEREILERCLYPLVNEGFRILEEGIALRPGDIDLVWIHGYGFPAFRGGPMYWAERVGLPEVLARLGHYGRATASDPADWAPAPLLERLVAADGRLDRWQTATDSSARSQA